MNPTQSLTPNQNLRSDKGSPAERKLKIALAILALVILFLSICLGFLWHFKEIAALQAELAQERALRLGAEANLAGEKARRAQEDLGEKERDLEAARQRIVGLEADLANEKAEKDKVKVALEGANSLVKALEGIVQRRDNELANARRQLGDATAQTVALQARLGAAQEELKRVRDEIGKFKNNSSPSQVLGDFLSKVGQPKTNSGYLDENICATRGQEPGCTKPKPP